MNRRPASNRMTNYPATMVFFAINLLFLVRTMASQDAGTLLEAGAVRTDRLWAGDYWRLLTAGFVHVGFAHFFMNMLGLLLLGRLAEQLLGVRWYTVLYLISGILGFAASQILHPVGVVTAGASASGFGIVGMILGSEMRRGRHVLEVFQYSLGRLLLFYIAFSFLFGLMQHNIDNYAHAGGFLGGFFGAYFLMRSPWEEKGQKRTWVRVAVALLMIEVVVYANVPVPNWIFHLYAGVERISRHEYEKVSDHLDLADELSGRSNNSDYYRSFLAGKRGEFDKGRALLDPYFPPTSTRPLPPGEVAAYLRHKYFGARGPQPLNWASLRHLASTAPDPSDVRRIMTHLTWLAILLQDLPQIAQFESYLTDEDPARRSYYALGTLGATRIMLGKTEAGLEDLDAALRYLKRELERSDDLSLEVALAYPPFLFSSDLEALFLSFQAIGEAGRGNSAEAERLRERALKLDPLCEARDIVAEKLGE
ncbi:MAG: rhomboid family intramembrane serine protease [Planctomycetota bacterium]